MDIKLASYFLLFFSGISLTCCFRYAPLGDISRDIFSDHQENVRVDHFLEDFQNDNSSGDGSGDGDETTAAPETTSTVQTTTTSLTTTPPPSELPDLTGEVFPMELSLQFNATCVPDDNCDDYDGPAKEVLEAAFGNTLGYDSVEVISYSAVSYATEDSMIVDYIVNYDLQTALDNSTDIVKDINDTVFPHLKSETILGADIDDDYIDTTAQSQLADAERDLVKYSTNLCSFEAADLCDFGYGCEETTNDTIGNYGAMCVYNCVSKYCNDDQNCLINNGGVAECICKDNFLQISSTSCFHQNYLIFICAVGGGILIIAVVVLLSVLLCRKRGEESDRESRLSAKDILYHERFKADEGQSFQMQNGNHLERGGSISSASSEGRRLGQGSTTFSGGAKAKSKSKAPPKNRQHHQAHHNKAYDWEDNERVHLEDLEDDRKDSHYDPYYQEILESESFKDFKPKLDHIDHNKVYAFRRPMFSSKEGEGSSQKTYKSRWEDTD